MFFLAFSNINSFNLYFILSAPKLVIKLPSPYFGAILSISKYSSSLLILYFSWAIFGRDNFWELIFFLLSISSLFEAFELEYISGNLFEFNDLFVVVLILEILFLIIIPPIPLFI